jgi:hypothetical protein
MLLLYGADDTKLQHIDDHPDKSPHEEHKITVENLRKALILQGATIAETGPFDDEVYSAWCTYIHDTLDGNSFIEATHMVQEGQTLGIIAKRYWLPSWKYLYEVNREKIGDNPDLLQPGIELIVPQWDSTTGDERIEEKGANAWDYTNGLRYLYPWALFSLTMGKDDGTTGRIVFDEKKQYQIRNAANNMLLATGEIGTSDELEVLVPDGIDAALAIDTIIYEWKSV